MSSRNSAPRVRRRRCSETMLEEVVTSFANSMEWGAGTERTPACEDWDNIGERWLVWL